MVYNLFCLVGRDRKTKRGAVARFRVDPDASAVALGDLLADGQSDPCAVELVPGV